MLLRISSLLLLAAALATSCMASLNGSTKLAPQVSKSREYQIVAAVSQDSQFAIIPHATMRPGCEAAQPAQALATPNPLLDQLDAAKIIVSFIIGADGRVYSPLILESASDTADRNLLNTVRAWRYRPAMCNGIPTEVEGKIEFSNRSSFK